MLVVSIVGLSLMSVEFVLSLAPEILKFTSNEFAVLILEARDTIGSLGLVLLFGSLLFDKRRPRNTLLLACLAILVITSCFDAVLSATNFGGSIAGLVSFGLLGLDLLVAGAFSVVAAIVFLRSVRSAGYWMLIMGVAFLAYGVGRLLVLLPFDWTGNEALDFVAREVRLLLGVATMVYFVYVPQIKSEKSKTV